MRKLGLLILAGLVAVSCRTSPAPSPVTFDSRLEEVFSLLAVPESREQARVELLAAGAEAVPMLLSHEAHPDNHVRWEIVNFLGTLRDERGLDLLIRRALEDENPHVRWRSLWALARIGPPERIVPHLESGLDGEGSAAWNAAIALSFFDSAQGLDLLHENVAHHDPFRRWEAINALGRVHDETSVRFLEPALGSPSARDRNEAVLTLGNIGGEKAVERLIAALSDEAASVRWRAAMALGKAGTPAIAPSLRSLAASDPDAEVREQAAKAAARLESRR